MAEGYHSEDFPEPSRTMESLALQCEAKWDVVVPSPLPVPVETMVNIIENLVPAHNLFNPVYVGSKALASAIEMRNKLQTLCRVSQRMNAIAVPYLYRIIVITDSNELTCLHETLMKKSLKQPAGLGGYIESLAVHQNIVPPRFGDGQYMSLGHFCNSLMSIIQESPRLTKFSLVPIAKGVFQISFLTLTTMSGRLIPQYPNLSDMQYLAGRGIQLRAIHAKSGNIRGDDLQRYTANTRRISGG